MLYLFEFGGVFVFFVFVFLFCFAYLYVLGECLFYSGKAAAGSDQGKFCFCIVLMESELEDL